MASEVFLHRALPCTTKSALCTAGSTVGVDFVVVVSSFEPQAATEPSARAAAATARIRGCAVFFMIVSRRLMGFHRRPLEVPGHRDRSPAHAKAGPRFREPVPGL